MEEEKKVKKTSTPKKKTSSTAAKKTTTTKKSSAKKKTTSKSKVSTSKNKTTTNKGTKTTTKSSTAKKKETPKAVKSKTKKEDNLNEIKTSESKVNKDVKLEKVEEPKEEVYGEGEPELLTDLFTKDFSKKVKSHLHDDEMADDFLKEFKPNYVKTVFCSIFWALVITLVIIWGWDLTMSLTENEPQFCLAKIIYEYDDGIVSECNGFGYNVYHYERGKEDKYIFRPFFIKYEIEKE